MTGEEPSRAAAVAAIVFMVLLVALMIWIVHGLIAGVRQQDCVLSGRRDCLDAPVR